MKDNYLSIVPADKERCVVVLNKSDYNEKCKELLTDDSTYKCNGQNPTSGYRKKVFNLIKNLFENNIINVMLKRKLDPPSESTILAFYGLPKIHRPKLILFRPIVSCIGSITYRLAKFAAGILCPLVGQSPHYVCNTMEFVVKNKNIRLYDSEILTSYDVLAQFTSIPANFTVNIIRQQLTDDPTLSSWSHKSQYRSNSWNHRTLFNHHIFFIQGIILQTNLGLCSGITTLTYCCKPLYGSFWDMCLWGIWRYQAKVVVPFCRWHVCDFGQESQGGFFQVHQQQGPKH